MNRIPEDQREPELPPNYEAALEEWRLILRGDPVDAYLGLSKLVKIADGELNFIWYPGWEREHYKKLLLDISKISPSSGE